MRLHWPPTPQDPDTIVGWTLVLLPVILYVGLILYGEARSSAEPKGHAMMVRVTLFLLCCSIGAMAAPRKATLAQQKMCAEQAGKVFHREYPDATTADSYLSHYDPGANICYVPLFETHTIDDKTNDFDEILDAFENRPYALFRGDSDQPVPDTCIIYPRNGSGEIHCKSKNAFLTLVGSTSTSTTKSGESSRLWTPLDPKPYHDSP